jgi:hypothetical protein
MDVHQQEQERRWRSVVAAAGRSALQQGQDGQKRSSSSISDSKVCPLQVKTSRNNLSTHGHAVQSGLWGYHGGVAA